MLQGPHGRLCCDGEADGDAAGRQKEDSPQRGIDPSLSSCGMVLARPLYPNSLGLGDLNKNNLFLHVLEARKSKTEALAGLTSWEGLSS